MSRQSNATNQFPESAPASDAVIAALRTRYAARDQAMPHGDWHRNIYHPRHPLGQLFREHNRAALIRTLNALELELPALRMLDVGCGYGHWLRTLVELDAAPQNLVGVDIAGERLMAAQAKHAGINWLAFDGKCLPLAAASLDWVMQVVVFSSVPTAELQQLLAAGMNRVLRPGGYLFWIDHQATQGHDLRGFTVETVQELFPRCRLVRQEALHPHYFRTLYRRSPWLASSLYQATRWDCDSWLLVLRKEAHAAE